MPVAPGYFGTITERRLAWLLYLEKHGKATRPLRSRVGYDCMVSGWTRWAPDESGIRYEELTQRGRDLLATYRRITAM